MGLTYIAIGTPEKVHVFKHIFAGGRTEVRNAASEAAMFYAIKVLKNSGLEYEEIIIK
jgi:nicotinamide mononucleotide (NMN) deamidase PncC